MSVARWLWLWLVAASSPGAVSGPARVVDGDTLVVTGVRVRLYGIDAPEHDQPCWNAAGARYPCGQRVTQALGAFLLGHEVTCLPEDTDPYGRTVARCFVGSVDVNRLLVRAGGAVAYTHYSRIYEADAAWARARRVGAWSGVFDPPSRWRHLSKSDKAARVREVERALRTAPTCRDVGSGVRH